MKHLALPLTLLLCLAPTLAQPRPARRAAAAGQAAGQTAATPVPAPGQTLPLRRVILYSNGVAYFERRGVVTGRAEINLSFKQSQIDDVLKSLVVLDLGKGRIGAVSYNSSAPPSARLNEIPFSIEAGTNGDDAAAGGIAGVLKQLQGARVAVTTATRAATGAVLNVDEHKLQPDEKKPPAVSRSLVIVSEGGELQSFDLAEVRSVKLLDEGTRQDIGEFAHASSLARRRDSKTISVTSDGEGQREMVVSYTVAAPIWKTTYRVVLDADGKPFFQGWAIVDNVGEEDWNNVQLSLVSGTPVSFIQPMQQPLYRHRPVMEIPDDLSLDPQRIDTAAVIQGVPGGTGIPGGVPGGAPSASFGGAASPPPPPASIQTRQVQNLELARNATSFSVPSTSISNAITEGESGVEAAATGSEVGELFEYRIEQPVTVRRDRSALIPILQTKLEGERVAFYNEANRRDRPFSSIRLKNTSPLTLEGGALTVVDGDAYAGEAMLERAKPNEQKFVSFALDLGTLVTSKQKAERRPVFLVRAGRGVFEAHYHQTQKKTYTAVNQTDRQRTVYVEHPVRDDWKLSDDTPKYVSRTTAHYRFRVELGPRETKDLVVTETQALMDSYQLSNLTRRDVELFVTSNYIDAATRAELEKLIEMKSRIAAVHARIEAADNEAEEIEEDQKRLRENIDKLKSTAEAKQLIARYVAKADTQETRLEQLEKDKRAAQEERARLQAELEVAIRAFALNRKL
jgi:chaperonin cofactor prefoldin